MFEIKGKYTTAKVMIDEIDETTMSQIYSMVNHPASTNPISIMPDCHAGSGCVVGFTMALSDKIVPNWVGVDLGCGMLSFNVGKRLFESITMKQFDEKVRDRIPFGTNVNSKSPMVGFDLKRINQKLHKFCLEFNSRFNMNMKPFVLSNESFSLLCKKVGVDEGRVYKSLQSLGGGNHFIEVSKSSETGNYWITIHSGSRNFGKCVAEYHQKVACRPKMSKGSFIEMVKSNYDRKEWEYQMSRYNELHTSSNQPKGSEYLEGEDMYNYLVDAMIAQEYASLNRSCMMKAITDVLCEEYVDYFLSEYIETVHNFIDFRDWIIRKGSIRSYEGERLILPFNMRDGILICEGKTNSEWNCSAPHGAGRVYSRSKAKATLNIKDVERQMKGIFTSCIPLDEAPDAYKDASVIEECIEPTAVIVDRLIPVLNMKCHG